MLYPAGILLGSLRTNSQAFKQGGEHTVTFKYGLSQALALFCQMDMIEFIHGYEPVLAHMLHGYADAGLGKAHFVCHIYAVDLRILF